MKQPMLYIFAGLPGSGKTTLSQLLAQKLGIMHLRIDTLEQGLRERCGIQPTAEGYELAYRLAADNLRLGLDVIADSCNPIPLSRDAWQQVSLDVGADYRNIEIRCSDLVEHRHQVERRESSIQGLKLPDWKAVTEREYHSWQGEYISLDTAGQSPDVSLQQLLKMLVKD